MPIENNLFSDIPSLSDTAGLSNFVENQNLQNLPNANATAPVLTQPATQTPQVVNPNLPPLAQPIIQTQVAPQVQQSQTQSQGAQTPIQPNQNQGYTPEQLQQIAAQNQRLMAQYQQPTQQVQYTQPQQFGQPEYNSQQANYIKQLIDRGVPLETILTTLNKGQQNVPNQVVQRLSALEQQIQQQQYEAERSSFVEKMTGFGNKFGLSEQDLVTFGNVAMSKGMNLTTIDDVEMVFRAIYPEQYAIRMQRMSKTPASQIYGGSNVPEAPRAESSKLEDAYVDSFLKQTMPNQYGIYKK